MRFIKLTCQTEYHVAQLEILSSRRGASKLAEMPVAQRAEGASQLHKGSPGFASTSEVPFEFQSIGMREQASISLSPEKKQKEER